MIKLPNSIEPAVMAENIVHLRDALASVDAKTLPDTSTATIGQILKLTGENKTPTWANEVDPHFSYSSTEERDSGFTFDGAPVYVRVFLGTIPEITATQSVIVSEGSLFGVNMVMSRLTFYLPTIQYPNQSNAVTYYPVTGVLSIQLVAATYSQGQYCLIVWYTKPVVPGNSKSPEDSDQEPEPEPEEKKTTKKKTTK